MMTCPTCQELDEELAIAATKRDIAYLRAYPSQNGPPRSVSADDIILLKEATEEYRRTSTKRTVHIEQCVREA